MTLSEVEAFKREICKLPGLHFTALFNNPFKSCDKSIGQDTFNFNLFCIKNGNIQHNQNYQSLYTKHKQLSGYLASAFGPMAEFKFGAQLFLYKHGIFHSMANRQN